MKQLNEIKRMQQLAGLIKENEEGSGYEYLANMEYEEGSGASDEELQSIIDFYKDEEMAWKYGGKEDFERLAQGYMADVKAEKYPTWKKGDFQTVLDKMNIKV